MGKYRDLPPLPPVPPGEEEPPKGGKDRRQTGIDPASLRIACEVAVFCTLALLGGGLLALVALTDIDLVYPATFYGLVLYVAWRRYFHQ